MTVVNIKSRPHYLRERTSVTIELGAANAPESGRFGKNKYYFSLPRYEPRTIQPVSQSIYPLRHLGADIKSSTAYSYKKNCLESYNIFDN